MQGAKVIKG